MSFVNPSLQNGKSILSEDEKKDIFDRISKVEEKIQIIESNNQTIKVEETPKIKEEDITLESPIIPSEPENKDEFTILDLPVTNATVSGKPSVLNIPIKQNNSQTEVQSSIKEEYTLLNINDYADKTYESTGNQRIVQLNELQKNKFDQINTSFTNVSDNSNNDMSNDIISIDNIMKIS